MTNTLKTRSVLAIVSMLVVVIVNAMAVLLPINQMSTGAISDLYPNYFVPAGFTFSIWSIIYLFLIAFCGYSAWYAFGKTGTKTKDGFLSELLKYFVITCIINCSWIICWHYLQIQLSLLVMLAFLVTLILIYRLILQNRQQLSGPTWFFIQVPFSIYLGWISVATIANATALLVHSGWEGGVISPVSWSSIMMLVATGLGLIFLWQWKDRTYTLVICWALYGIYFKQGEQPLLARTAVIGIVLLLLAMAYQYWRGSKKSPGL
jgi:hypothetical protein